LATDPTPRLIAGRDASGRYVFPLPADGEYQPVELPRQGTLWSYTVQRFAPKSPPFRGLLPFEPFAVGYVKLGATLIIESRLTGVAFDAMRIGMPMELTTLQIPTAPEGEMLTTFAFRPVTAGST